MSVKNILDLKYKQKPRMTSTIHIRHFNDGLVVSAFLPGGIEPLEVSGKDYHYTLARFYNKVRRAGFVANGNVVEKTFNQERPR